jgi:hypothetical protein
MSPPPHAVPPGDVFLNSVVARQYHELPGGREPAGDRAAESAVAEVPP